MKFFNELIETIMNKSRAGFGLSNRTSVSVSNNPKEMLTSVMTAVGEVSSIAYADQFLRLFDEMDLAKETLQEQVRRQSGKANPYDSLGDYYLAVNDNSMALKYFEQSAMMGLKASESKVDSLKSLLSD